MREKKQLKRKTKHLSVDDIGILKTYRWKNSITTYLENSPPGQFPTVQVLALMSGFMVGSGPGGE